MYTIKFVFVNYYIENLEINGAYGIKDYSSKHSLPKSIKHIKKSSAIKVALISILTSRSYLSSKIHFL
ncbi:hypothetical protein T06_11807 [Trichinella sp. T6]|nr:hypothetical protein T06_11807 [Trichinella sp. T6]